MKKICLLATVALFIMAGCQQEEVTPLELTSEDYTLNTQTRGSGVGSAAYPNNEMVVRFDPSVSEADKQLLRNQYGVVDTKKCECADPTLELWIFALDPHGNPTNGIDIEETVLGAKEETELEGAEVNPIFKHMGSKLTVSFGIEDTGAALARRVSSNENVTIAVLDTGVDYNYFGFETPFLYNTEAGQNSCNDNGMEDLFGWDFVNQDNNPYDDYGHGTVISSIIYQRLEQQNVDFQILPVKAFDGNGNGAYFDILCGFKYALNNEDVDVINMSFGWYHDNYELLDRFVEESEEKVMLITSAGNRSQNNDLIPHFPSSYDVSNNIAVAALSSNPYNIELARFSNFGNNSVDIAAFGEHIPFYLTPTEYIFVSGTSYANAFASAFSGVQYQPGISPQEHVGLVISNTIPHSNLSTIQYQSYIYY